MPNLPDSAFEPKIENEKSSDFTPGIPYPCPSPPPPGIQPGQVPNGKIPAGEQMRKVTYTKCMLIKGTETEWLHLADGCIVYRVRKDCFYVSETWWESHVPSRVKVSSTEDNPKQETYLKSQSWVLQKWCPDNTVTSLPGDEVIVGEPPRPVDPPPPPPVFIPPKEVKWGGGMHLHPPPGNFLISKEPWERMIPPAQQDGCYITAKYKRYYKVMTTALPSPPGQTTYSEEDYTPETVTTYRFLIPGCEEQKLLKMATPSLDKEMSILSGQEKWSPGPGMWVLGRNVRVKFEVSEDARRRGLDIKAELALFVKESLADVIPAVADVLSSDPTDKKDREVHPQRKQRRS